MAINLQDLLAHLIPQIRPGANPGSGPMADPVFGGGPNPDGSISAVGQAPQGEAPEQDAGSVMAPHQFRGMFGLHGGLRNILGTLGDAFLVQQGAHPVYAPRLQQEREANAMQHLQDNPMAAVQALSLANPEAAREMYHNVIRDNAYAADQRSQEVTRAQTTEDRARAAFSALGGAANARTWPAIRQRLMTMRDNGHLDVPDELLPEQFSDDVPGALLRLGTAPGTQMTADNLDDYRTHRLGQIDAAQTERGQYHQGQLALGSRRATTGEQGVAIAGRNADTNQGRLTVDQQNARTRAQAEAWNEAHPSRSRRTAPGGGGVAPQMQEGGRYREHGTGRIYHVANGQKVYE